MRNHREKKKNTKKSHDQNLCEAAASRNIYIRWKKLSRTHHTHVVVKYQFTSHSYGNKKVAPWHHRWNSIKYDVHNSITMDITSETWLCLNLSGWVKILFKWHVNGLTSNKTYLTTLISTYLHLPVIKFWEITERKKKT